MCLGHDRSEVREAEGLTMMSDPYATSPHGSGGNPTGSSGGNPARTDGASTNPAKVAFASFIGTTVEWYDYFLFGTAAVLVLNEQFFPSLDPLAGQLASLSTFAVAFVARPLGGLIFGHFGDKLSRKSMLVLSLLMMRSEEHTSELQSRGHLVCRLLL